MSHRSFLNLNLLLIKISSSWLQVNFVLLILVVLICSDTVRHWFMFYSILNTVIFLALDKEIDFKVFFIMHIKSYSLLCQC